MRMYTCLRLKAIKSQEMAHWLINEVKVSHHGHAQHTQHSFC